MSVILRRMFLSLAFFFLAWELVAFLLWLRQTGDLGHAPGHLWRTLRSDWMALIIVSDHLVMAGAVLVGLWLDATRLGWGASRRFGLALAFVAVGSPALLTYLAWRLRARERRAAA